MNDTKPEFSEPDEYGTPPMVAVDTPPVAVPADDKPKGRPTTRAGRRAAAAARKASGTDAKPKATKPTPRKASLETRLAGALSSMGMMLAAGGGVAGSGALSQDGLVVIQHSADLAAAINKVADQDPRVKAALEKMLTAGVWSGVAMAALPVVLAIAGNHNLIPPQIAAMLSGPPAPAAQPAAA